jgi:putative hemolysin
MRVGDLTVRDLMVARSEIVWIDETETIETVRVLVGTCPHSHFPVCRGSIDQLVGVVHIKDLISYGLLTGASFSIASVATKPLFVPETTPALDMLARFRSGTTHIAFVVDEYGVTMGLVTINDVTGAIVGDIRRPGDAAAPRLKLRDDGSWLVDGRVPLHELLDGLEADAKIRSQVPDVSTAGGLLFSALGHLPREGQTVVWCGLQMEVVDMDGTRVDKLIIRKLPDAPE